MDQENINGNRQDAVFNNSPQKNKEARLIRADMISAVIIFLFGIFVFATGIYIAFFTVSGTDIWYYSPGMFPILVGAALILFSALLFINKRRTGVRIGKIDLHHLKSVFTVSTSLRLLLAVVLLAVYVFGLVGRLPFVVATFLYLSVTMICFRKDHFAIWKILIISAVTTGAIYLFFGVIAAVPLP